MIDSDWTIIHPIVYDMPRTFAETSRKKMVFSSPCRSWYEELKPRLADAMLTTLVGETKTAKGTNFEALR